MMQTFQNQGNPHVYVVVERLGGDILVSERDGRHTARHLAQVVIPCSMAPRVAARLWPEGAAALRAILTAAEVSPSDVFEGSDDTPLYDDGTFFTLGLLAQIRAAVAQLEPPEDPR